jgi:hypothetical protein
MGNTTAAPRGRASKGGDAASGADAYTINLTDDNKLGGGNYADVYKIQKKDT